MKKFFYLLLASVFAFTLASCSDDDDDELGGGNGGNEVIAPIVGDYESTLSSYLLEMPTEPSKTRATVSIQKAGEGKINVVLPTYSAGMMGIPSITLKGLDVTFKNNVYTFGVEKKEGSIQVGGENKNYVVSFSGSVNADGTYKFHEEIKYGNMPFTVVIDYSNFTTSSILSGDYKSLMSVGLVEMPGKPSLAKDTVRIVEQTATSVSVSLPGYKAGKVNLPSVTVEGVEVVEKDGKYVFEKEVKNGEMQEGTETKTYNLLVKGELMADGTFKFHEEMKYGGMPMTVVIDYSNYSHAAILANDYNVDFSVALKNDPSNVLVSGSDVLKISAGKRGALNAVIPEISYEKMHMTIPALTVEGLDVKENADGSYDLTLKDFKGEDKATQKPFTVSFTGHIQANGAYEFSADVQYGDMPLTLVATYKQPVPEKK